MSRRHVELALLLGLAACGVDERRLANVTPPATGGTSSHGDGGAAGDGGEGGDGTTGSSSGLVDGCADLDTDGVADCAVTLVENPSFESDESGWTPDPNTKLSWNKKNALGDRPSGSARLRTDTPRTSARQCVELDGEQLVIAYANAFIEPSDEADAPNQALLEVSFFDDDSCSGISNRSFNTPPSTLTGQWVIVQAGNLSFETTRSVSIALVGLKQLSAPELGVYFDNVMLKAQAP